MITSIVFFVLFIIAFIIGTVFAFSAFFMYTGRFGCDKTPFEMAVIPIISCVLFYVMSYVLLMFSHMEWAF